MQSPPISSSAKISPCSHLLLSEPVALLSTSLSCCIGWDILKLENGMFFDALDRGSVGWWVGVAVDWPGSQR